MDTNRPGPNAPQVPGTSVMNPALPPTGGPSAAGAPPRPASPGIILPPKNPAPAPTISPPGGAGLKIQHKQPGFGPANPPPAALTGQRAMEEALRPMSNIDETAKPLPIADGAGLTTGGGKITAFGKEKHHEDRWSRSPNTTGSGAIHVKTFHCKLTDDALVYLDQAINEWLDAHPEYEVKFVSSTIGTMTGKLKEPALVCQVWV